MSSSFFPPFESPIEPEDVDDVEVLEPVWAGQPHDVLPGTLALAVELGRSPTTVVRLEDVRVFPEGFVFRLAVRIRHTSMRERTRVLGQLDVTHGRGMLHLGLPQGGLRWGFEYADGQRVTTLDRSPWTQVPAEADPMDWVPAGLVLARAGQ